MNEEQLMAGAFSIFLLDDRQGLDSSKEVPSQLAAFFIEWQRRIVQRLGPLVDLVGQEHLVVIHAAKQPLVVGQRGHGPAVVKRRAILAGRLRPASIFMPGRPITGSRGCRCSC